MSATLTTAGHTSSSTTNLTNPYLKSSPTLLKGGEGGKKTVTYKATTTSSTCSGIQLNTKSSVSLTSSSKYGCGLITSSSTTKQTKKPTTTTSKSIGTKLTSSPLTSSPLTSSPLTSGKLTNDRLASNTKLTSGPLTSSLNSSVKLTNSGLTNDRLASNSSATLTSRSSSSPLTSSSLTSSFLTASRPLTSSQLSGQLTSGNITNDRLTSSMLSHGKLLPNNDQLTSSLTSGSQSLKSSTISTTTTTVLPSNKPFTTSTSSMKTSKLTTKPSTVKPTLATTIKLSKPNVTMTTKSSIKTTQSSSLIKTPTKSLVATTMSSNKQRVNPQSQYITIIEETDDLPVYDATFETTPTINPPQFRIMKGPQLLTQMSNRGTNVPDVFKYKMSLVQSVATSLLCAPDYYNKKDPTVRHLRKLGETLSHYDSEFLLKVALYTRCDLNIRSTANFLLALAATSPVYRPYLKKYFSAAVRLPSDWIEIAQMYTAFHDKSINFGSLPTALRKVMSKKFTEFDAYQLAKYNKDITKKKKPKKGGKGKKETKEEKKKPTPPGPFLAAAKGKGPSPVATQVSTATTDTDSSSDEDEIEKGTESSESEEELERLKFTLKQIIRKLHISDPVYHVMCLIGKKYPETPEDFRLTGLPGTWDQDRAGKRMKLPTPETWETQVSLRGNKSHVWEELIDHQKLPFMAMLRNIRNLILAGVSMKHHQWVIGKLNDQRAVVNSRQFPFRFFSAYEVLNTLETQSKAPVSSISIQKGNNPMKRKQVTKKPKKPPPVIDTELIRRYRNALDSALMISTYHNVEPIKGSTIVLCNGGSNMKKPCTTARGLGKPRTVAEIGILLALMCKYACERCQFCVYGETKHNTIQLREGTILHNMDHVLTTLTAQGIDTGEGAIPSQYLRSLLIDRIVVDNLIVLTDEMNMESRDGKGLLNFLDKYRQLVNPNLLFVSIDLSSRSVGVANTVTPTHRNNIHLAGYSDKLLQFIAQRGDPNGQLVYINRIDEAYKLKDVKSPSLLPTSGGTSSLSAITRPPQTQWKTLRVFISSTFRDMHGERDLLTRYVFPELRRRCQERRIYVYELDLRWGVTEEETRHHKALEICMSEVSKSHYFIGLLGQRYGWCPEKYEIPDSSNFDWIREYPTGRSITELEMYHGALSDPDKVTGKAFFYFRDKSVLGEIPTKYIHHFKDDSNEMETKIESLKSQIRFSGLEVYDNYPTHWMGVVQNKPMLGCLEDFGKRVLDNLWNAIQRDYPEDDEISQSPLENSWQLNNDLMYNQASAFIGRKSLLKQALLSIQSPNNNNNNIVIISGKAGSGKTAFMAALGQQLSEKPTNVVIPFFIGSFPGSCSISLVLSSLCWGGKKRLSQDKNIPNTYLELAKEWLTFLIPHEEEQKSIIIIDAIDLLDDQDNGRSLDWLTSVTIPDNVTIAISVNEDSPCHNILKKQDPAPKDVTVGNLDMSDKAQIVRERLAKYRKHLDESPFNNQMKLLLTKREASNPLFLYLACEELRMFGIYEEIGSFLKKLPTTVAGILQEILSRLEEEHGVELTSSALTLLCLVRDGLKENELSEILSNLFSNTASKGKIPLAVFARLIRSLQTFLQPFKNEHSDILILSHKDIEKAVKNRYLKGAQADRERQLHKVISQYFQSCVDPNKDYSFTGNDPHSFAELPYHLLSAGDSKQLENVVCNLRFAIQKCQLGLSKELMKDYTPSIEGLPTVKVREITRYTQLPKVIEFKEFISRNLHVLMTTPSLTLQQAINEPKTSIVYNKARELVSHVTHPLMYWINKPQNNVTCKMVIPCQNDPAHTIAISPNGQLLAVGYSSSIIKLFNIETSKEIKSFIGHASSINCICFVTQDLFCSASNDNTLSLWNVTEGHRVAIMKGHTRSVKYCIADNNGKTIVSVSWDTTIRVWKGNDGSFLSVLKSGGRNSPINCVSFHPEGKLIVVGCWDSTLKIWDTFNKKKLKTLKGHGSSVQTCSYLKTGQHIVSASLDGDVRIWSAKTGITVGTINGHADPINSLSFTSDGNHLLTASSDKVVKMWTSTLGCPLPSLGEGGKHGHSTCLLYDNDTQLVTVGYHDGYICQYSSQTGHEVLHHGLHSRPITSLCVVNQIYMTASRDQTLKIWSPSSLPDNVVTLEEHTGPITIATWTKHALVSAGEDFIIHLWPTDVGKYLKDKKKINNKISPIGTLTGHTGEITGIAISASGITMATVSHDKSIIVWNLFNKKLLQTIPNAHPDWINACIFTKSSPEYLLTGSNDFNIKVWNNNSNGELTHKTTLTGHLSPVTSLSCNEGCIVSGSSNGNIKVWTKKGIEITTLSASKQIINSVCIASLTESPDTDMWAGGEEEEGEGSSASTKYGKNLDDIIILSTSNDGTVSIWKPFVPNEISVLKGHSDRVLSVGCSPANNTIVTSSLDETIRVWQPSQLTTRLEVRGSQGKSHTGSVTGISITRNPKTGSILAATIGRDGYFLIWSLKNNEGTGANEDKDDLILLYRIRGSDKGLSSVTLARKLAIGDDLGKLNVWSLSETQSPVVDRKISSGKLMNNSPISCIALTNDNKWIVTSCWSGQVIALQSSGRQIDVEMEGHKDWVLDVCTDNNNTVYSIGVDNVLVEYPPLKAPPTQTTGRGSRKGGRAPVSTKQTITGTKHQIPLSPDGEKSHWPLVITKIQDNYIGITNSNGYIYLWNKSSKRFEVIQKIHQDSATCMKSFDNYVITASSDCTVKVWEITSSNDGCTKLKQVGHFDCISSVTALDVLPLTKDNEKINCLIMIGDCTGSVTLLNWK